MVEGKCAGWKCAEHRLEMCKATLLWLKDAGVGVNEFIMIVFLQLLQIDCCLQNLRQEQTVLLVG